MKAADFEDAALRRGTITFEAIDQSVNPAFRTAQGGIERLSLALVADGELQGAQGFRITLKSDDVAFGASRCEGSLVSEGRGFGRDVVADFKGGRGAGDVLVFSRLVLQDFDALMGATRTVGGDAAIRVGGSAQVVPEDVPPRTLHADDFDLV